MGSSFTPSCNPVTGRISIRSLRRLKRSNKGASPRSGGSACNVSADPLMFNVERRTSNAQRRIGRLRVRRSAFGVGRSAFSSALGRVKGAWWPSRSSKPSSVGNGRGRFDSYPLRNSRSLMFDGRRLIEMRALQYIRPQTSNLNHQTSKGGESDAARADS